MKTKKNTDSDIVQTLGIDKSTGGRKNLRRFVVIAALVVVATIVMIVWKTADKPNSTQYVTQEAQRGDLTVTVTATGTLEPTNQVDVGSELSGIINTVEVDYNDRVKVGQILAWLDPSRLEAQVLQSKSALESAQARILEAQATVSEMRSQLKRLERVRELSDNKVPSQQDLDAAEAALQRALAEEVSAKAQASEAQATLRLYETDLGKLIIRSPINGIVLMRDVELGQTVAASFQTPVLFTLAEDLTQMELHVDVDEADVSQVKEGQKATFTVDAYPNRSFPARIIQVRYGSQTIEGVVTYETVLRVENSDLSLRPGMTATADIKVTQIDNVLLVPNAALRFFPPSSGMGPPKNGGITGHPLMPRPSQPPKLPEGMIGGKNRQIVWTVRDGKLVPIPLKTGATDGTMTEVLEGEVEPGMALVVESGSVER